MDERSILEFYRLQTLNPTEWPAENNSDASDSEDEEKRKKLQRRKSRYQALERSTTRRSLMGSEPSGKGGGLVMKDEPDPLGTTDSVIRTLRQLGLPVQENPRIRNRFLLSSTAFTPSLFLSQLHANADSKSLVAGLDALTRSIDEKSASLKVLVESNFERFVKAKATIDNVYKEMKYRGAEQPAQGLARGHSRHASRSSFRNSPLNNPVSSPVNDARRKNALVKESEYGVVGIKTPLLDVTAKAEDVWGPALGGREKEESLKTISANIERFKEYTELSAAIADSIKRKDYESLVEEYNRARRIADEARSTTQNLAGDATPSDQQLYQIILACRMWHDVDEQMKSFKREIWRSLTSVHTVSKTENLPSHPEDRHMELISLLLELGVDDNPIWLWLLSRYDFLKGRIQMTAERAKVEIEILRRRLANADKPSPQGTASYLRSLSRQSMENKPSLLDSGDVIEFWEKTLSFITTILSPQGLLGEILEFWDTAKGFTSGTTQKTLPGGFNGESKKFHRLSVEGTTSLEKAVVELVDMIRDHIFSFFASLPPEDISLLFSPMPKSPSSPPPTQTPISGTLSPGGMRFSLDANNLPPPSPKRGEAWEKFAFWPPWSNSVSGVHYLSKILALIGAGAAELATIQPLGGSEGVAVERLKALVGAARERSVTALCAAWNKDAENIKYVEDWHRAESGDVTRMPASFAAFEGSLLGGMQKILYISEAMAKPGAEYIVLPPQAKLLQMVRSQYVTTLYKALSGMVENAERSLKQTDDEWTTDIDGPAVASSGPAGPAGKGTLDASDRNVRMLLTLSNLQALRATVVPALNTQFENAFSVKLTDESKTIRDVLGQIDARLFQTYTRPFVDSSKSIIKAGIADPGWSPPPGKKPTEARPYIYELLLNLVLVHTQVSTTAPSLTSQVLSFLLEQVTRELLETYRSRQRYTLEGLMQATLDVEFVAQTLSQYTTERASELQAQVYQELDSRTDDSTRARLQGELPEMRVVLKRLREGSKMEFACFRKARRAAGGGSQG